MLILKDAEDLSYEEIRGILQLPITTLKIRVVRARAMLREIVERGGTDLVSDAAERASPALDRRAAHAGAVDAAARSSPRPRSSRA